MGRAVIKTSRDEDLYMVFSTYVDTVTMIGTRAELSEEGIRDWEFERADQYGSSSMRQRGLWESEDLTLLAEDGKWHSLRRKDFSQYAHLMLEDRDAEAEALLEISPMEDDE